MPGSWTSPDRPGARANALVRVAFRGGKRVGVRDYRTFAAQWLACTIPCRRLADTLAGAAARLGADVDRYPFIVVDFSPPTPCQSPGALPRFLLLSGTATHLDHAHQRAIMVESDERFGQVVGLGHGAPPSMSAQRWCLRPRRSPHSFFSIALGGLLRADQSSAVSAASPSPSGDPIIASATRPAFSRIFTSITSAMSGFDFRKVRAFSLPCPIR